jgi:hypothetical protein
MLIQSLWNCIPLTCIFPLLGTHSLSATMTSQQNDPTTVSGSVADTRIDLADHHRQWAALREQHRQRWKVRLLNARWYYF